MTENQDQHLEAQLSDLTRWEGKPTELWQKALDEADKIKEPRRFSLSSPLLQMAAAFVVLLTIIGLLPFVMEPTDSGQPGLESGDLRQLGPVGTSRAAPGTDWPKSVATDLVPARGGALGEGWGGDNPVITSAVFKGNPALQDVPPEERHVVRKATIELVTDDVAAVFVKCTQLLSEAHGEFIESSSLSGSGIDAKANLTLRVAASRLSAVLNDLRGMGTVRSEDSRGEDVTSQVVDIEARLRNE
jgi:hypothetical protein